jgi:hypothetical protein
MRVLQTLVKLSFYADYPEDDLEADAQADRISDDLTRAIEALPYVSAGSVSIPYLDTRDG